MSVTAEARLPVLCHLELTDQGRKRLDEVLAFLDRLDAAGHALAVKARGEFTERLLYLDGFGGAVSETDARRRYQVTLGADMYELSFTVTWRQLKQESGAYTYSFNGGLIWHGGPGDPMVVCLVPDMLWGIHT